MDKNKEDKYGVFAYNIETDENVDKFYYPTLEEAMHFAQNLASTLHNHYVEVWKKGEDGLWGNTGEPFWKSDKYDGVIETMGIPTYELRCLKKCGNSDVSVDPKTGVCSECKAVYKIIAVEFTAGGKKII